MAKQFQQTVWDQDLANDWEQVLALAVEEDLGGAGDLTTLALVPPDAMARASVVARRPGVVAGLPVAALAVHAVDARLRWQPLLADGAVCQSGTELARLAGPAASILAAERLLLNTLSRLSGVATLTRRYVDLIAGTRANIYDTRKTTPGWRKLEKYAVRCGGGVNHRGGLFEAVLIKDNHLAFGRQDATGGGYSPAQAVEQARAYLADRFGLDRAGKIVVEIEVDTLEQLDEVLGVGPDLVLLDNMTPAQMNLAVERRNARSPRTDLEASGGVNFDTVRAIAETGVERISIGALTHSAVALDIGLDWREQ